MTYELWAGDVRLGRSTLDFLHLSPVTFSGDFTAEPAQEGAVAALAINIDCVASWMQRDTQNAAGEFIVRPEFRQSRLFTTIGEILERQFDASLHLRRADGTAIPTQHVAIRDMEQLTLYPELIAEAIGAADEASREPDDGFNINPESRELFRELQAAWEEEDRANAWRGALANGDTDVEFEELKATLEAEHQRLRSRFQLHVVIAREGGIPADVTWMD